MPEITELGEADAGPDRRGATRLISIGLVLAALSGFFMLPLIAPGPSRPGLFATRPIASATIPTEPGGTTPSLPLVPTPDGIQVLVRAGATLPAGFVPRPSSEQWRCAPGDVLPARIVVADGRAMLVPNAPAIQRFVCELEREPLPFDKIAR